MFDRNVLFLNLTVKKLGIKRKVSTDSFDVPTDEGATQVDKTLLTAQKRILDSPEYKVIERLDRRVHLLVASYALPCGFMKKGIYPIPLGLVERCDQGLEDLRVQFDVAVLRMCEVYEARQQEAEARLGPLYNARDYPDVSVVRAAFGITAQYVSFGVPGELASLNRELYDRERDKAAVEWSNAMEEMRLAMRLGFKELVEHMADKLTPSLDGEKKRLHESSVSKFKQFIETFDIKNITDDIALKDMVDKARDVLAGNSVGELKTNEGVRSQVKAAFDSMKDDLAAMVEDAPRRMILVED